MFCSIIKEILIFAYELLLERAYRLWNENPLVLTDIAEQYRQDGKKGKGGRFL